MQSLKPLWNWSFWKWQDFVNIPLKYYFSPGLINTFFKGTKKELCIINSCHSKLKMWVRFKRKKKNNTPQKSNWAQGISHSTPRMRNGEWLDIATFTSPADCIIYIQDRTSFATVKNVSFFHKLYKGNFLRLYNLSFQF